MVKIFYDAEFTGLHRNANLISIGLVTDTDPISTFYAEFTDYDINQITPWIQKNVIDNLILSDYDYHDIPCMPEIKSTTINIREKLINWLETIHHEKKEQIQFVMDCYAYDWMLLVDLITENKTALDMPEYIYYIPIDLSTMFFNNGIDPDVSREKFVEDRCEDILMELNAKHFTKHNALWDAMIIKNCFARLM